MSLQRIALAHLLASTIWATCSLPIGAMIGRHLVQVQLSLRTLVADPMHPLLAAKGGIMRVDAILRVLLIVPLMQQWMLHCCKCWPRCTPSLSFATTGTAAVIFCSILHWSLPFKAACWALPLSLKFTAHQRLLRCLGILVMVPILCLSWCFGCQRVVLTN